ncbi:retrotransposon-like family member retr-1 [Paramuricea clavata]|uniref:Retrotransposon-like family member retr-1 n=1 Tax=Paramuricea clavata TaxID=317549 RepID=A0A7D9JQH4_PARCT|nr:retrotransposon-like family member retr-1 [Paramuricea clavata]
MDICRANEISLEQAKSLTNATDGLTTEVNALKKVHQSERDINSNRRSQDRRRNSFNRTSKMSATTCTRCGGKHDEQQKCPAIGATCHKCKKPNHYSRMCRTRTNEKNVHSREAEASTRNSDSESNDSFFIGAIHAQDENKEWTTSLKVNNTNVMFKIDTEAECIVISRKTYEELSKTTLEKSRTKLGAFGGQKLKTIGKFTTLCTYKKECVESTSTAPEDIFEQYSDVFTGLGYIKGVVHHIETDPTVKPIIHTPRRVSAPLRQNVKDELDRMESLGVIERVQQPTEWVNSLVTVVNPMEKYDCVLTRRT